MTFAVAQRDVMGTLERVSTRAGLSDLAERMGDLAKLVVHDLRDVEAALGAVHGAPNIVHQGAQRLIALGGKRLRPVCVAVAARCGNGFDDRAKELAVAVELVHCATLLHDDVVDVGDERRGAPTARLLYGNAASIFGGDWLLVEALRRVAKSGVDGALTRLLDIIDEMIVAEAIQLEQRGRVDTSAETYFDIVDGKTAALFRWATFAGACAGGLGANDARLLEQYGSHLGSAFQLMDDYLDYAGAEKNLGKIPFADLREGKMTYPLLYTRDRNPAFLPLLESAVKSETDAIASAPEILRSLDAAGALVATRDLATAHVTKAIECISAFPAGRAKEALVTVARTTIERQS